MYKKKTKLEKVISNAGIWIVDSFAIIFTLFIIIILWGAVLISLNDTIKEGEAMECREWRRMEQEIEGFYWVDWQIQQCENYKEEAIDSEN